MTSNNYYIMDGTELVYVYGRRDRKMVEYGGAAINMRLIPKETTFLQVGKDSKKHRLSKSVKVILHKNSILSSNSGYYNIYPN